MRRPEGVGLCFDRSHKIPLSAASGEDYGRGAERG